MSEKPASVVRYERAIQELAREYFWRHPESAPERIAKHYCAHAIIAFETCQLIKYSQLMHSLNGKDSADVLACIHRNIEQIKRNHLADFGTPIIAENDEVL